MNLREIELFGTLMRVGTTIETARVLGISQAGVSAQLKRMESHIGFRLFHRNGNRLQPTAEAHRLFQETTPIFTAYAQVVGLLDDLAIKAEAPVSVSATPAVVEGFLAPHLGAAGFTDWRKRLRLLVTDPESDVRNGFADLGIQMAVPPKIEFHSYRLTPVPMYAVCGKNSPLASCSSLKIADIHNRHLVAYNPVISPMGQAICDAFQSQGKPYDPACIVPFTSTVCQMVEACGGVGIIDELTVKHLRQSSLVTIPVSDIPPIRIVVFHRREPLSAAVQDLLHCLIDT
ncbi:LysR family transcriptional regulator [Pseudorhodobacter sp.]|uniref:LysR family transcriptional regulator n=1 Tax=Pseudorhodobacter sp. TaxID=1934400 RepID=UPI00264935D8|nr:LysR family transcriptional regulator [Pseudorhodobacter sp.]MDN5786800.1 LysR family transcriptional regulator [Pseudorhodobacter sp.]